MSDNSFTTKEAHTLKSMMRRPEMAKLIREAINTPVGSTSRMRAQKLFKIVNKLNTAYDGVGGSGMPYQASHPQPEMEQIQMPTDNPKGVVIFHKIPKPKIVYGKRTQKDKPQVPPLDGGGGPGLSGIYDGKGGLINDAFSSIAALVSRPFTETAHAESPTPQSPSAALKDFSIKNASVQDPSAALKNFSINNSPDLYPGIQDLKPSDYWSGIKSIASPVLNYAVKPVVGAVAGTLGALGTATSGVLGGAEWLGRLGINTVRNLAGDNSVQGKTVPSPSDVFMWRNGVRSENVSAPLAWGFDAYGNKKPSEQFSALAGQPTTPVSTTTPSEALKNFSIANSPQSGPVQPGATQPGSGQDWLAFLKGGEGNVSANTQPSQAPQATTPTTPSSFSALSSGLSGVSNTASTAGSQFGSAALNVQKALGGIDLNTPLSQAVTTPEAFAALVKGIVSNEGSSPAGVMNNPGNIKFAGLPGQVDSGVKATDGGTFASYATIDDGLRAVGSIISNAAAGNSSAYGAAPTIGSFMNTYTNTGPGSTHGGSSLGGSLAEQIVNEGLNRNLGAGMTADAMVRAQTGMSEEEAIATQRKSLRDLYGIDELREESWKLTQEQNILPKVAQDYIIQHDTYIRDTDKNIGDYIDKVITKGSGDPADIQMAQSQLAYLYTVRGRQNQSYVQFIRDAVSEHQAKLDGVNHNLEVAINGYNEAIATELPLTQARYERLYNNAVEMYEEIKNAPMEAMQMKLYQQQLLEATGGGATDSIKYWNDNNLIAQGKDLQGYTWNKDQYVTPEMLNQPMQLLNEANAVQQQNPNIHFNNILDTYSKGYTNYLDAPLDKDAQTGYGITIDRKIQVAKNAISQWQDVAEAAAAGGDTVLGNYALAQIQDIIEPRLNSLVAGSIVSTGKGAQYMEAVKQLAPTGWFGGEKEPPTEQEFVDIVTGLTGDAKDESVARSIYESFVGYMNSMDKPSPSAFVNQMIYSEGALVSPEEFSRRVGQMLSGGTR